MVQQPHCCKCFRMNSSLSQDEPQLDSPYYQYVECHIRCPSTHPSDTELSHPYNLPSNLTFFYIRCLECFPMRLQYSLNDNNSQKPVAQHSLLKIHNLLRKASIQQSQLLNNPSHRFWDTCQLRRGKRLRRYGGYSGSYFTSRYQYTTFPPQTKVRINQW